MYNLITPRETLIINDFFTLCIPQDENKVLMDIVVTPSFIKEYHNSNKQNQRRIVDALPAKDINIIYGNQKYRTYRVVAKEWDRVIKTMSILATPYDPDKEVDLEKVPTSPFELILETPTQQTGAENPTYYAQPTIMQDLGVDWPVSVLTADNSAYWGDLTDGDFARLEDRFEVLAKLFRNCAQAVKANLNVLVNDATIVRNHNLHFSHFIDFENSELASSLTRMGYKVKPGDKEEYSITPIKLDPKDWQEVFTSETSRRVVERLSVVFTGLNDYISLHLKDDKLRHPALREMAHQMLNNIWSMIMPMSEPVYSMNEPALGKELDEAMEEVLSVAVSSTDNPGLDINSWKIYDYTDIENPTFVLDISNGPVLEQFRPEFMTLLYSKMLRSQHKLIKPYVTKTLITDPEEIKARPIGDVKYLSLTEAEKQSPSKEEGLRRGELNLISAETPASKSQLN